MGLFSDFESKRENKQKKCYHRCQLLLSSLTLTSSSSSYEWPLNKDHKKNEINSFKFVWMMILLNTQFRYDDDDDIQLNRVSNISLNKHSFELNSFCWWCLIEFELSLFRLNIIHNWYWQWLQSKWWWCCWQSTTIITNNFHQINNQNMMEEKNG